MSPNAPITVPSVPVRTKRASKTKDGYSSSAISVSEVRALDPDQLEGRDQHTQLSKSIDIDDALDVLLPLEN
jgi:hypothetical protein